MPQNPVAPLPRVSIHPDLLMTIMYGSPGGRRFTQDTPVLPEVWSRCAEKPGAPIEGLIVPRKDHQAHHIASEIYGRLSAYRELRGLQHRDRYGISDLPGLVTTSCYFDEVVNVILPLTRWWMTDGMNELVKLREDAVVTATQAALTLLKEQLNQSGSDRPSFEVTATYLGDYYKHLGADSTEIWVSDSTVRLLIVLGAMTAAQNGSLPSDTPGDDGEPDWITKLSNLDPESVGAGLAKVLQIGFLRNRNVPQTKFYAERVQEARHHHAVALKHAHDGRDHDEEDAFDFQLVFTLSINRKGGASVFNSVPTTKADAARRLFALADGDITWAVIDSGIDSEHFAFRRYPDGFVPDSSDPSVDRTRLGRGESRVIARYKMAFVRRLRDRDELNELPQRQALASEIAAYIDLATPGDVPPTAKDVLPLLEDALEDLKNSRPLNWDLAERLIRVRHEMVPRSHHGTHVAGILGGRWPEIRSGKKIWIEGMCPQIKLMDFDVMGADIRATEFAVVSALRLIRHLNERNDFKVIHGANLSLAIPHDVTNYACGQTPVCAECGNLVSNGVVVVAAAGNVGYNVFKTKNGDVPLHTATSIADPGNAEAVITVGSTHRLEPHTYGVSYFSSRGPTGDGRMKPDLVAPGEKISAPICNGEFATLEGTSMAAPHVSGAAALLMARFPELIGNPIRIKDILCSTATDLGRERAYQGCGLVDVLRALQSV